MMIAAGDLDCRVSIQQRTGTQDATGQPVDSWNVLATAWASVRQQSGLQAIRGGGEVSIVRASIRLRYRTDVDSGMRVVVGPTTYLVTAVLHDIREGRTDLVCEVVS